MVIVSYLLRQSGIKYWMAHDFHMPDRPHHNTTALPAPALFSQPLTVKGGSSFGQHVRYDGQYSELHDLELDWTDWLIPTKGIWRT